MVMTTVARRQSSASALPDPPNATIAPLRVNAQPRSSQRGPAAAWRQSAVSTPPALLPHSSAVKRSRLVSESSNRPSLDRYPASRPSPVTRTRGSGAIATSTTAAATAPSPARRHGLRHRQSQTPAPAIRQSVAAGHAATGITAPASLTRSWRWRATDPAPTPSAPRRLSPIQPASARARERPRA